ncbi:MAG: ROK family protein [Calditrichia bacterium]
MKEQLSKICYIGVDIGGTAIKSGLISSSGLLLHFHKRSMRNINKHQEIVELLFEIITDLLNWASKEKYIVNGIGVGSPGRVNVNSGKILGQPVNISDWTEINLREYIQSRFNLPTIIDNDANMATLGEYFHGNGKNFKNMIFITLGTGIGGGIVVDGKLIRGSHFAGGELGHITIDYQGLPCICGGIGCWEQYASASALVHFYNIKSKSPVESAYKFFERIVLGEELAEKVLNDYYKYIGIGLISFINIFDPEAIIFGGGISESEIFQLSEIKNLVIKNTLSGGEIEFLKASLGNKAGIIGAAELIKHQVKYATII